MFAVSYLCKTRSFRLDLRIFNINAANNSIDPSKWIVQTKGWALSHNSSTTKQKMMMGKVM
jgi:hypothetical protein